MPSEEAWATAARHYRRMYEAAEHTIDRQDEIVTMQREKIERDRAIAQDIEDLCRRLAELAGRLTEILEPDAITADELFEEEEEASASG